MCCMREFRLRARTLHLLIRSTSSKDYYVTVQAQTDGKVFPQIGTTEAKVPIIENPYSDYSYADGNYYVDKDTKLVDIFKDIIHEFI